MSEAPFVPFYTSDFLAGTSGLTAAARGVYITLLCLMYESEAPLLQSWDTLARRCGCTLPAFRRAVESLEDDGKIAVSEAGIWSPKCEKHIALRRERQRSATAAAKKRWEKDKENQRKRDAAASSAQCKPEPEPEPEPEGGSITDVIPPPTRGGGKSEIDQKEHRENLLNAMGVKGGISGPSSFIGGVTDMAEAERWAKMGLSISMQIAVIREVCAKQSRTHPGWRPSTFRYFTPAMERLANVKAQPVEDAAAAQVAKWNKIAESYG